MCACITLQPNLMVCVCSLVCRLLLGSYYFKLNRRLWWLSDIPIQCPNCLVYPKWSKCEWVMITWNEKYELRMRIGEKGEFREEKKKRTKQIMFFEPFSIPKSPHRCSTNGSRSLWRLLKANFIRFHFSWMDNPTLPLFCTSYFIFKFP